MAETIITDKAMQGRPGGVDRWLVEAGARGFGRLVGRITPAGERRFYYRYTDSRGDQVRLLLGPYDPRGSGEHTFTVQQARSRAQEWSALYRSGIRDLREHFAQQRADVEQAEIDAKLAEEADRLAAAAQARLAAVEQERRLSLRQLFERWCAVELQPHRRADSKRAGRKDGGQYTRDQFERHVFPSLGARAATDIRKSDLLAILDKVKSEGKLRTCNVLLSDLKQMFAFALAREIVERSPLDTVSRRHAGGTDALRERVLLTVEIAQLARRIPVANLHPRSAAAIWILLASGCRIGELMGSVWAGADVDLAYLAALPETKDVKVGAVDITAAKWYLPTTKNERDHTIHLSAFALKQFQALLALRECGRDGKPVPWVFPNTSATGPVDVKSFGKQLADRQRSEDRRLPGRSKNTASLALPGGRWTAHDLRRTAGTLMASLGVSGDVIDECLNHVIESRVRRTYIRDRRPQEQARAFEALGAQLEAIIRSDALEPFVMGPPSAAG